MFTLVIHITNSKNKYRYVLYFKKNNKFINDNLHF